MHRLKGKVEAYVVSTMEDNQRTSLLDNLAISIEKVEEEAEIQNKKHNEKIVRDDKLIDDLCGSLLSVLEHELKTTSTRQKPSFWTVAENITPKDTIKMIYRLNIQQTDKTRSLAWARLTLKEATISSYMSLLRDDNSLLKEWYRSSAFVRDKQKMETACELISQAVSTIIFSFSIEGHRENTINDQNIGIAPEIPQEILYTARKPSTSSIDTNGRRRKKGSRSSSANIATISDEPPDVSSSWTGENNLTNLISPQGSHRIVSHSLNENSLTHSGQGARDAELRENTSSKTPADDTDSYDKQQPFATNRLKVFGSLTHSELSPFKEVIPSSSKERGTSSHFEPYGYHDEPETSVKNNVAERSIDHDVEMDSVDVSSGKISEDSNKDSETFMADIVERYDDMEDESGKDTEESGKAVEESVKIIDVIESSLDIVERDYNIEEESGKYTEESGKAVKESVKIIDEIESSGEKCEASITENVEMDTQIVEAVENIEESGKCVEYLGEHNQESRKGDQESGEYTEISELDKEQSDTDNEKSELSETPSQGSLFLDNRQDDLLEAKVITTVEANRENLKEEESPYAREGLKLDLDGTEIIENSNIVSQNEDNLDYSLFEPELNDKQERLSQEGVDDDSGEKFEGVRKSNSSCGGSQQMVNVLQLSTSANSVDDYFIPGIHKSPEPEITIKSTKPEPITPTHASSQHRNETDSSYRSATLPSTLGSSFGSYRYTDSESDSLSMSDQSFLLADLGITDDFIGIKEDHFSTPESFMGFSSTEELENAIATCKQLIKQTNEKSAGRRELIQQLVHLRLKLHESKDTPTEVPKNIKKVLGHHFVKQDKLANSIPCDCCSSTIFPLLQVVYQCKDCGFHCHRKCLKILDKGCIFSKQAVHSVCEMRICPEIALSQQQFRCADCHQRFMEVDGQFDARLCDYTGKQYCSKCHWNELITIPARVIHNWDFSLRKVSRQSKQLLLLRAKKADINLQKLNPALFNFLDELRNIKTLREQLIMMKEYIRTCRIAAEERMLLQLENRQHFVENSYIFSMQDLLDIPSNVLYEELVKKIELFGKHIKQDCPLCMGKGFICEKCKSDDIIFPFDEHVIRCKCNATYHRSCFIEDNCPKCIRTARRMQDKERPDGDK